ncbi:KTSC domain-containing protein [Levilactobacillus andaensis]|uniref:KTSC domain-containing protein n=1 Tax=Levilactobacillus andaensis TaxID=2799570 RepID=UPI0019415882|nr:KTSC domain-containing protein [Levilactobacillus andaensis]
MEITDLPDNAVRQHFQLHYDDLARLLEVHLITGEIYVYRDVTRATYQHFIDAAHPALYYHNVIAHHGCIQIRFNSLHLSEIGRDAAEMLPLPKSHLIATIAYDNAQSLLLVNFIEKRQLLYPNVPRETIEILLHALDPDEYYKESITVKYACCAVK